MTTNTAIKKLIHHEPLPLAWLDLDRLEKNIATLKTMASPLKIRIASKSIRCRYVIKYLLEKYPDIFEGILAFHPEEAQWLAENGLNDIVVAYPYLRWFEQQAVVKKQWQEITFMVDRIEHLDAIQKMAQKLEAKINICFDIDLSTRHFGIYFGVYRSSIKNLDLLTNRLQHLKKCPNLVLRGLMGYEAQIAGVADKNPFKKILNPVIRFLKMASIKQVIDRRIAMVKRCESFGYKLDFVNGGGTGSLHLTKKDSSVTELAAGSGLYSPLLFDYYQDFHFESAAGFALEVTRRSRDKTYTAAGGGYIASGAIGLDKSPRPFRDEKIQLDANEGCGEVQTPLHTEQSVELGDAVLFRHAKAGELCERFNQLYLIKDNTMTKMPTYRGEGQCFL